MQDAKARSGWDEWNWPLDRDNFREILVLENRYENLLDSVSKFTRRCRTLISVSATSCLRIGRGRCFWHWLVIHLPCSPRKAGPLLCFVTFAWQKLIMLKISQDKIAQAAGVSHETINNLVHHLRNTQEAKFLDPDNLALNLWFIRSPSLVCSKKKSLSLCSCGKCDHGSSYQCKACECCWK